MRVKWGLKPVLAKIRIRRAGSLGSIRHMQLIIFIKLSPLVQPKMCTSPTKVLNSWVDFACSLIHDWFRLQVCNERILPETRLGCFYVTAILSWGSGWGWVEIDIEVEVNLRLRLKGGWVKVHFVCFRQFWYLFLFNFGVIFYFLGPLWANIGLGEGFKHCFRVYSCTWTTFIFYVTLDSDIWFWLNFGVIFYFLGP